MSVVARTKPTLVSEATKFAVEIPVLTGIAFRHSKLRGQLRRGLEEGEKKTYNFQTLQ